MTRNSNALEVNLATPVGHNGPCWCVEKSKSPITDSKYCLLACLFNALAPSLTLGGYLWNNIRINLSLCFWGVVFLAQRAPPNDGAGFSLLLLQTVFGWHI